MSLTSKQRGILARLDELKVRKLRSGLWGYFLDGVNQVPTINSMIVKGVLVRDSKGQVTANLPSGPLV